MYACNRALSLFENLFTADPYPSAYVPSHCDLHCFSMGYLRKVHEQGFSGTVQTGPGMHTLHNRQLQLARGDGSAYLNLKGMDPSCVVKADVVLHVSLCAPSVHAHVLVPVGLQPHLQAEQCLILFTLSKQVLRVCN